MSEVEVWRGPNLTADQRAGAEGFGTTTTGPAPREGEEDLSES